MKKVLFVIIGVTFLIFIIFLILGSVFTDKFVEEEISKINNLTAVSKSLSHIDSTESLPFAVRKYFKYSILDSSFAPRTARLKIKGQFKTAENSNWQELNADQYYSISQPAYIWNAKIKMNEFVWSRAIETFLEGRGNILIKLFSTLKISDASGEALNQSGLARYLFESAFYPNALVQDSTVKWEYIDQGIVRAVIKYKSQKAEADFYINASGQITKIETSDRYRTVSTGYKKTLFSIEFSDYKEFGKFVIPSSFQTSWHTDNGKFIFGRFIVENANYE